MRSTSRPAAAPASSRARSPRIWAAQRCTSWPGKLGSAKLSPALAAGSSPPAGRRVDRLADERHGVHQLGGRGRQFQAQLVRQRRGREHLREGAHHQRVDRVAEVHHLGARRIAGSASSRLEPHPPATGSRSPAGRARSRTGPWSAPPAPRGWRRSARSASPRGAPARPRPAARSPPPRAGRRRGR